MWTYGEERGRRADFILEYHPDLMTKLKLKIPTENTTKKECQRMKKRKDCADRKECEWLDNKCEAVEVSDKWMI